MNPGLRRGASLGELAAWYAGQEDAASHARRCYMYVPEGLLGKRVLDVNCRNGKGVYKFGCEVGAAGFVLGTSLTAAQVEAANADMDARLADGRLVHRNMQICQAFPEDLSAVAKDGAFDLAYLNSSINTAFSMEAALAEVARALAPGGELLWHTVVASGKRDAAVLEAARHMGNGVQAALPRPELEARLTAAGFTGIHIELREEVPVTLGANDDIFASAVESTETITFHDAIITASK